MTALMAGGVVGGKYRLEREIGRGGMGSVWAALDIQLERHVAIKFIRAERASSREARSRFAHEAKAVARLRTPHVVQIFDHGIDDETPYIVMEMLEGEDLGARLAREKRLPIEVIAAIVAQASKALKLAHEAGIVHRDLKPSNVFLARSGDEEIVKILDFGIAKATGGAPLEDTTKTGEIVGSPHYMSPEQALGEKTIGPTSDLWALAVIVYQALTGARPFRGETLGDMIVKICRDPIPPPSSVAPDLSPDVDAFFERALSRTPSARFATAREFAAALATLSGMRASIFDLGRPSMAPPEAADRAPLGASGAKTAESAAPRITARPVHPATWGVLIASSLALVLAAIFVLRGGGSNSSQPASSASPMSAPASATVEPPKQTPSPEASARVEPEGARSEATASGSQTATRGTAALPSSASAATTKGPAGSPTGAPRTTTPPANKSPVFGF